MIKFLFQKGNQIRRGMIPWSKGKKMPLEVRKKQSLAHQNKKLSEEHKKNIGLSLLKPRKIKFCLFCGESYDITERLYEKNKFCSRKCSSKYNAPKIGFGTFEFSSKAGKIGGGKIALKYKGKSYEEIFGEEKAKEMKNKLSESHKGLKIRLGMKHSKESKQKMSLRRKNKTYEEIYGKENAEKIKKKMSLLKKGKPHTKKWIEKIRRSNLGKKRSEEIRRANSIQTKKLWGDPIYRERMIKRIFSKRLPTSVEKNYITFFNTFNLPFTYCGNGSLLIGYKNPDFYENNGRKICVEVGWKKEKALKRKGRQYSNWQEYEQKRTEHFAKYGWECIVLWQEELSNSEELLEKIKGVLDEK